MVAPRQLRRPAGGDGGQGLEETNAEVGAERRSVALVDEGEENVVDARLGHSAVVAQHVQNRQHDLQPY